LRLRCCCLCSAAWYGIKFSEEKLGYNNAKTQEEYGPPIAAEFLSKIEFPCDKLKIVCEITCNHHMATRYADVELIILRIADKIVNKNEGEVWFIVDCNI